MNAIEQIKTSFSRKRTKDQNLLIYFSLLGGFLCLLEFFMLLDIILGIQYFIGFFSLFVNKIWTVGAIKIFLSGDLSLAIILIFTFLWLFTAFMLIMHPKDGAAMIIFMMYINMFSYIYSFFHDSFFILISKGFYSSFIIPLALLFIGIYFSISYLIMKKAKKFIDSVSVTHPE